MDDTSQSSDSAPKRRGPRWSRILLALGLGLLLTLGLLEAGLWIAYGVHSPKVRVEPLGEGSRTILCTGDSNTYGVHLEREQSYPGQLQSFLQRAPDNPWRVVNIGYPGNNSAQVRGKLARAIEEHEPEIVIAWVGTNNTWSTAGRHLWKTPDREGATNSFDELLQKSRVLKLGRMVMNKLAGRTGAPRAMNPEYIRKTLDMDWRRIQAICAEQGADLMMADYPVHITYSEENVNHNLQRISGELGIPIVDLHDDLLPLFYGLGYKRTMFGDYHANNVGNYEVARRMLLSLIEAGFLEPRPEWLEVPPLAETLDDWPLRIVESDAERAEVLLHGPPDARYRLVLGRLYTIENDKTINGALKSKWYQALSDEQRQERGWIGALDAEGNATLELELPPEPAAHPKPPEGQPVWLGWQLKLELETADGPLALPDKIAHTVILLDPTFERP